MGWLAEYLIVVAYLYGVCAALLDGAFGLAYLYDRLHPYEPHVPSREVADLMVRGSESDDRRRRAA